MTLPVTRHLKEWTKPAATATLMAAGVYRRWCSRLPLNRVVILMYHHVTREADATSAEWAPFQRGVSGGRFERQMRFLRTSMTPISLRHAVAAIRREVPLPPRAVVVTFDDGYLDNFTVAYPILKKYRIPATVFVTTGFIETGRTFWWDDVYSIVRQTPRTVVDGSGLASLLGITVASSRTYHLTRRSGRVRAAEDMIEMLRKAPCEEKAAGLAWVRAELGQAAHIVPDNTRMMNWRQLREMNRNGIAIESHTHTHPVLGLSEPRIAEEELSTSKELIEHHLGQVVTGVAYPDGLPGTYNDLTFKAAETVGLRFGCIASPTKVSPGANPFCLGRVSVANVPRSVFVRDLLVTYSAA